MKLDESGVPILRSADGDKAPYRLKLPKLERVALLMSIAASVISAIGIWVWVDEKSDRDDERKARSEERASRAMDGEARRISLIGQAYAAIELAASDGTFDTDDSGLTRWALKALQDEGEPIRIVADTVMISGVDFTCTKLKINAKTIGFSDVLIRNSEIDLDVEGPMDVWIMRSGLLGSFFSVSWAGREGSKPEEPISISGSELSDVSIMQYRQVTPAGSKEKMYRQEASPSLAVFDSRSRELKLLGSGGTSRVRFLGADAAFRSWEAKCQKGEFFVDCPSAGSDMAPLSVMGKPMQIPMEQPSCDQPSRNVGLRFEPSRAQK